MENTQAPPIETAPNDKAPGVQSRLVYDKVRRTIVTKQTEISHPLASFGYSRPPHWLWRKSQRAYVFVAAVKDIWLIATGRLTLHRAWQAGHDCRLMMEAQRPRPSNSEG